MSGKLYFPLAEAIRVAVATLGAPEHTDSFGDKEDGKRTGPALMWVKDSGSYLMSNAIPRVENDVIYARAHSRDGLLLDDSRNDDVWATTREICGGDDFAEYLTLAGLINAMQECEARGLTQLVLVVEEDSINIGMEA